VRKFNLNIPQVVASMVNWSSRRLFSSSFSTFFFSVISWRVPRSSIICPEASFFAWPRFIIQRWAPSMLTISSSTSKGSPVSTVFCMACSCFFQLSAVMSASCPARFGTGEPGSIPMILYNWGDQVTLSLWTSQLQLPIFVSFCASLRWTSLSCSAFSVMVCLSCRASWRVSRWRIKAISFLRASFSWRRESCALSSIPASIEFFSRSVKCYIRQPMSL